MNRKNSILLFSIICMVLLLVVTNHDKKSDSVSFVHVENEHEREISKAVAADARKMISEKDWKEAIKEIAKDLKDKQMDHNCFNKTWRGNWLDCNTSPFVVKKPCLVYSFGINYHFVADDAFAAIGCEVFSFDPRLKHFDWNHPTVAASNHMAAFEEWRVNMIEMERYPWPGLAGTSSKKFSPRLDIYTKKDPSQQWEIRTLKDIMTSLGHEQRHIDYFKMDIEFYEWDAIDTMLKDNLMSKIKQMGLEFHIFPDTPKTKIVQYWTIYNRFKEAGFQKFSANVFEYNLNEKSRRLQSDCEFVNMKFDFLKYKIE